MRRTQTWVAVGAGIVAAALLWFGTNPDMIAYPCNDQGWVCQVFWICSCS